MNFFAKNMKRSNKRSNRLTRAIILARNGLKTMTSFVYKLAQLLRRIGYDFQEEKDPRVQAMRKAIRDLGSIQFKIEVFPNGSWTAESTNLDGIITGGTNKDNINETLKDAVFTYFEIPPRLCNDSLMRSSDEPMRLEQRVYV